MLGFEGAFKLYWWQDLVLTWFENTLHRVKGSLATPNGSGKSSILIPALVLWWLGVHPLGRVVITTKDSKQLDNQIWPGLTRHKEKFPHWRWIEREIHNQTGGFCIGFTTDEPGRAEGWHKIDDFTGPLLIICDEAKSIPNNIFEAIDRCTFNALLYVSSPGLTQGMFYDSQTKLTHGFKRLQIGLKDCPHIPKERIADIISKYGIDHPFTQSTLFGRFVDSDAESMFVVPRSAVRALLDTPPAFEHGGQRAYCDFAAGGNENVLAHMRGNKVMPLICWKDPNPMAAVARFVIEFTRRGLKPNEIWAGESGIDIPIMARFRELGWPINGVNVQEKPRDPTYENRGAEIWHEGSQVIQRGEVILPENDEILVAQLTARKIKLLSDGRLGIERKKDMISRGLESPDRGDAVLGVVTIAQKMESTVFDKVGLDRLQTMALPSQPEHGELVQVGDEGLSYNVNPVSPWLKVWERPVFGLSYVAILDPARHSEPTLDHSLIVLRVGFEDEKTKKFRPTRLVARVMLPCKHPTGLLVDQAKRLCGWYGECPIIPIYNDRSDLIEALLKGGFIVYVRENFDRFKAGGLTESFEFGWETNQYTKSHWINALAESIREQSVDIEDTGAVMQLHMLSANNSDTMRDAEAIGVGLKCIGFAAQNRPKRKSFIPRWERTAETTMIS